MPEWEASRNASKHGNMEFDTYTMPDGEVYDAVGSLDGETVYGTRCAIVANGEVTFGNAEELA